MPLHGECSGLYRHLRRGSAFVFRLSCYRRSGAPWNPAFILSLFLHLMHARAGAEFLCSSRRHRRRCVQCERRSRRNAPRCSFVPPCSLTPSYHIVPVESAPGRPSTPSRMWMVLGSNPARCIKSDTVDRVSLSIQQTVTGLGWFAGRTLESSSVESHSKSFVQNFENLKLLLELERSLYVSRSSLWLNNRQ
ncbi:hypothetical protein C8R43DRAFT_43271 [Mycena crocata]|nr:hypothetical protein C8R43DRAFT_366981 [Mycena crocata]KAJ7123241.1 hypothetical protein C8R43DRAFT_43271 [Mycena crocata]